MTASFNYTVILAFAAWNILGLVAVLAGQSRFHKTLGRNKKATLALFAVLSPVFTAMLLFVTGIMNFVEE